VSDSSVPNGPKSPPRDRADRQGALPFASSHVDAGPSSDREERVSGVIERVTYHDEETGFCVLRVKAPRRRELVTVVGRAASPAPGEHIDALGRWQADPRHGPQLRAVELRTSAPSTREGIARYLGSGMIRGIGPEMARRLIEAFGEEVFDVIERTPARLREVRGVGEVRAARVVEAWADQKRIREIMVFLHSHGVGTSRAVRIHRSYGEGAVERIREDPYCLARDIRGIGFVTADALAERLGIEKGAPVRVRAGLRHVLAEALSEGHCGLPGEELFQRAEVLLEVGSAALEAALADVIALGDLVRDTVDDRDCVFLSGLHGAERSAAERLLALTRGALPWPEIDPARALPWVEAQQGFALAASQREALATALRSKVTVLTGGPGVGKTTLVNALLRILTAKGVRSALAAPTGRAAKRLGEATGLPAHTLHRLLEADPGRGGFRRGPSNPLDCELLVVDETSMVDVPLLHALLRALRPGAALLLIGDVDQLPSVGPGQVLADMIESGVLPVVRLHEVFRQAAQSRIVRSAHRINEGRMPELDPEPEGDFFFLECDDPDLAAERLLQVVSERIPARFGLDPVRDVQVLCPMHRGRLGARGLNLALQQHLNPPERSGPRVERFGTGFGVGDKLMQVENDYEKDVYNGDLGFVERVDAEARQLVVRFDARQVPYTFDELDSLALAYAITVHKAQGSEYPAVVIPVVTQHYPMLRRNLLYTAITRGRRLVVVIGQRRALAIAVRGAGPSRRWSKLREWLKSGSPCPSPPALR